MMSQPTLDVRGHLPLKRQMELLTMPRQMRRRLLSRTARQVIASGKRRVKTQTDLTGQPFAERKRKRARKMLSRLVRELQVVSNDGTRAKVGWRRMSSARIAAKQQFGDTETVTAASLPQGTPEGRRAPATRRQAKALREAGFTIKSANGKRRKTPTIKWITENMVIGQAGAALRALRDSQNTTSWKTKLPARSFLGATAVETTGYVEQVFNDMKREMNYVAR